MNDDVNELFFRDPLELTDEDIEKIIERYREKRHLFAKDGLKGVKGPKLTEKEKKTKEELGDLDIKI